jgi:hypothetical protein
MAWAFGAKGAMSHASGTHTTPLSVAYPTGITAGQILVLAWSHAVTSGKVATPSGGWTSIAERVGSGGTPRFFVKIAAGTESGSITVGSDADGWCSAQIARFTGGPSTLTGIVNVTPTSAGGSSGLDLPRAPAITPSVNNTLVLRMGAKNTPASGISPIAGSGFTEIDEGTPGFQRMMYWEYLVQTTATAVASGTWDITTNDVSAASCGLAVALVSGTTTPPTITSVSTDNVLTATETNVAAPGTNYTSSGTIELVDGAIRRTLSQDSWSSTAIQFDMSLGNVRYGTDKFIVVTTSGGLSASRQVTVNPPAGKQVFDLTVLRPLIFDSRNTPSRLYSSPDLADNAQIELAITGGTGTVTVDADGRLEWDDTVTQIQWRFHNGTVWSSLYTWDLRGLAPLYIGPAPSTLTLTEDAAMASVNHSVRFTNEDGDTLTYTVQGGSLPAGTTLSSSTGVESGTPTDAGSTTGLRIRATDTGLMYAETPTFGRNIEAAPNPPSFVGNIAPIIGRIGQSLTAYDAGSQFLFCTSFAIDPPAPSGVVFNTTTGEISGVPAVSGIFPGYTITGFGTGTPAVSNEFSFDISINLVDTPDVEDLSQAAAIAAIEAAGLVVSISTEFDASIALGFVISQSPVSGTDLPAGSVVSIVVSRGPGLERVRNQVTSERRVRIQRF